MKRVLAISIIVILAAGLAWAVTVRPKATTEPDLHPVAKYTLDLGDGVVLEMKRVSYEVDIKADYRRLAVDLVISGPDDGIWVSRSGWAERSSIPVRWDFEGVSFTDSFGRQGNGFFYQLGIGNYSTLECTQIHGVIDPLENGKNPQGLNKSFTFTLPQFQ